MAETVRLLLYAALVLVSAPFSSNSRSATHWKLASNGSIVPVERGCGHVDPVFVLLNSRSGDERMTQFSPDSLPVSYDSWASDDGPAFSDSQWISPDDLAGEKSAEESLLDGIGKVANPTSLPGDSLSSFVLQNQAISVIEGNSERYAHNSRLPVDGLVTSSDETARYSRLNVSSPLTCGPPVRHTKYDTLESLRRRDEYPVLRELEVAVIFKKASSNVINLTAVEIELRDAIALEPKPSLALLNELGNFWRVQGNTLEAVECFRSALHQEPDNADVLLNLARLLLNIGYVEDARALAYRSLAAASPEQNSWLQHFTLADTYERSGEQEKTIRELSHTLDLNPGFKPAEMLLYHLKQKQSSGLDSYLLWTVTIIVTLSAVVLVLLYSLLVCNQAQVTEDSRCQACKGHTHDRDRRISADQHSQSDQAGVSNVRRRKIFLDWLTL